jgi:phospholipid/cholesterol/gamma-HCH transport system permease protein
MKNSDPQAARLEQSTTEDGGVIFRCLGDWTVNTLETVVTPLDAASLTLRDAAIKCDVSAIGKIDSAGITLLMQLQDRLAANGCTVELHGQRTDFMELYDLLRPLVTTPPQSERTYLSPLLAPLSSLGEAVMHLWCDILGFIAFIGENFIALVMALMHPASIRYAAIVKNIEDAGVRALPIITLTSFLIGVVIAYQGAVQLQKFGANIFIVDMIGIAITRELAPLITAIVVAGRTGSSFTAQLGTMKMTEEIDAMRIMGFEPHHFLVLPRIIALMIALPLMIFFADIVGIFGGMIVSNIHLNISYHEFITRLREVLEVKHLWIGLIKGPFFAWLIAITGCYRGLQVSRDTESIGRNTTVSVVNAIFLVIACDALFSVVLTELGI